MPSLFTVPNQLTNNIRQFTDNMWEVVLSAICWTWQ